ncbi:MAG: hypothetical protein R6X02_11020 [Enhygromyxa sp.]
MSKQLGEEPVLCEFCQGTYSVQLEVVCDECERALCPLCATRSRRTYRCPECDPTARFPARVDG